MILPEYCHEKTTSTLPAEGFTPVEITRINLDYASAGKGTPGIQVEFTFKGFKVQEIFWKHVEGAMQAFKGLLRAIGTYEAVKRRNYDAQNSDLLGRRCLGNVKHSSDMNGEPIASVRSFKPLETETYQQPEPQYPESSAPQEKSNDLPF